MEVIILAGGLGTRLKSVVKDVPKCMAPVAGMPFLWYLLKYLSKYNIDKVILSIGYMCNVIIEWIEKNKYEFPYEFEYAIEDTPLGTGGGIRLALGKANNESVIVLNGDTFYDVDLNYLDSVHRAKRKPISLALKMMRGFDRYGSVDVSPDCSIVAFNEKAYCREGYINGGIYIINKSCIFLEDLPYKFSFEKDVLEPFCRAGKLNGVVQDGYFIDIGIPIDYKKAELDFPSLFA